MEFSVQDFDAGIIRAWPGCFKTIVQILLVFSESCLCLSEFIVVLLFRIKWYVSLKAEFLGFGKFNAAVYFILADEGRRHGELNFLFFTLCVLSDCQTARRKHC